jgi:APA family basic amino acid/polyamine antiporter
VLGGVAAVAVLYVLVNAAVLYAAPVQVLSGRADVAVAAVEALGVPALQVGVRPVVALALFTSIAAMVWTGAEVWRHLASEGHLPRVLTGHRTALAVQAGLAMGVASVTVLRDMLGYIGLTLSVSSALTVAGLFALRARGVGRYRDLIVPGAFIVATAVGTGWMAWQQPVPTAISAVTLLVAGVVGWVSSARATARTTR